MISVTYALICFEHYAALLTVTWMPPFEQLDEPGSDRVLCAPVDLYYLNLGYIYEALQLLHFNPDVVN